MTFVDAIKSVFSKYATFQGRARRSEYWYFTLANTIVSILLYALAQNSTFFTRIYGIYGLAVFLPGLAVMVRRLHDTGRSGWRWLFAFIPLVGAILVIVWLATDSENGANRYGEDPKGIERSFERANIKPSEPGNPFSGTSASNYSNNIPSGNGVDLKKETYNTDPFRDK